MTESCPKCGYAEVETDDCPRCRVSVSKHRDYLEKLPTRPPASPIARDQNRWSLSALVCPPLYFAQRKKWFVFVISGAIYAESLWLVATGLYFMIFTATEPSVITVLIGLGLICWLFCLAAIESSRWRERAKARARSESPRRLPTWKEIICPPAYFAHDRKWQAFVINGLSYLVSLFLIAVAVTGTAPPSLMTGVLFWLFCLAGIDRRRYIKIILSLVVLVPSIGMALLLGVSSMRAQDQAGAFCAQVVVGGPIEGLAAKAREAGLVVASRAAQGAGVGTITAIARGPFSAGCVVEHINGRVVKKWTYSNA